MTKTYIVSDYWHKTTPDYEKLLGIRVAEKFMETHFIHDLEFTIEHNMAANSKSYYVFYPHGASKKLLKNFVYTCAVHHKYQMDDKDMEYAIMDDFSSVLTQYMAVNLGSNIIENIDSLTKL